jgi:hypothetical protein
LDLKFARETLDQMDSPRASATYKCPSNVISPAAEWFLSIDISPPRKGISSFSLRMLVFLQTQRRAHFKFFHSKVLPLLLSYLRGSKFVH